MAELTEAVAEVAESVAEDALTVATISRSLSGRDLGIGFVIGAGLSSLVTFWWVRRHFETKFDELVASEIAEMREYYLAKRVAAEDKPDLETMVEERGYVPSPPGGLNVAIPSPIEEPIKMRNAFEGDWDYEEELASRSSEVPYVIHQDEFKEGDYTSVTLTYYEGDDVLCDENNTPVDNKERLVGEDNLSKFGHGSSDSHIVYIRNDSLTLDIELVKVDETFVEQIHGLKHSDRRRRLPKFDDET